MRDWFAVLGFVALAPGATVAQQAPSARAASGAEADVRSTFESFFQAAGAVLTVTGFARGTRGGGAWALAAAGVLALSFTPSLSGHAAASQGLAPVAVLADALHVLGAGGWLRSLLLLVVLGVPAAMRLEKDVRGRAVAGLVNAFSPTALLFAGVVVATGVFATWLHVGSIESLWASGYGRTLPLQLAVGVLVLGITAALVATSPPAEMEMATTTDGVPGVPAEPRP